MEQYENLQTESFEKEIDVQDFIENCVDVAYFTECCSKCPNYGKTWSCPPACGELDYWEERCSHYSKGLILQTVGDREDSYDFEAMMEVAEENKRQFEAFTDALRASGADFLAMSAGTCTRCEKEKETETLPKLEHLFEGAPVCTVCGAENPDYTKPSEKEEASE